MKILATTLSLLMLVGAGCFSMKSSPTPAPVPTNTPTEEISVSIEGDWELKSFTAAGGSAQDVSSLGATMKVEAGAQLSAKICNSMSGEYDIQAGLLTVDALAMTKMFCEGLIGEVESSFVQGLSSGMTIEHGGDSLVLRGNFGGEFSFVRAGSSGRMGAPSEEVPGEDATYAGTVTSVDLEKMMVDGPARIVVRTESGADAIILVPSMGLGLCKAKAAIADVYTLKVGESVEARGSVGAEANSIVPCQSEAHYLRVVTK